MDISVIIPTRRTDDGTAARCVASVLPQLGPGDEVIVTADGEIEAGAFSEVGGARVLSGVHGGPGRARNRALEIASNPIILFLNDDVIARAGLLEAHRSVHARRLSEGNGPAMVLGSAPWHRFDDDRVIDRLLRETSMIFFYDRMGTSDPGMDWGYRHAWTLNLSLPAATTVRFDERLEQPMFDDLEWAFRVHQATRSPVLYHPEAAVTHRHRYEPVMLLRREALLGHQALALMRANAECGHDVFGDRFVHDPVSIRDHESKITDKLDDARTAFGEIVVRADSPAESIGREGITRLFESARVWRDVARSSGFLSAISGEDAGTAQHRAQTLIG